MPTPYRLAVLAALVLSACATSQGVARTQGAEERLEDEQLEAGLREHHRHQHRGGVMQFVAMGLDTLGPSDASRPEVERIQGDLYRCMATTGEVQRTLHLLIAEGVSAGAVDLAKVDALIGQLDVAGAEVQACSAGALNRLHAVLAPAERAELVEKVQAHWEVWRQVNQEDPAAGRAAGGRLAALAREVSLTPEQVEQAAAALHVALAGRASPFDRDGVEARVQAFAVAFSAAAFDATSAAPLERARLASYGATRMAIFYETVTPLLTAAQRAELAGHLREHAGQHPTLSNN